MDINKELIAFLDSSPTCFHAVDNIRRTLKENGYRELSEAEHWDLSAGNYFCTRNDSSLIAFRIPQGEWNGFMIGAAHSDSPAFKIKENPDIHKDGMTVLNVEKYGGMLCAPWFDRPLSAAGRAVVKENGRLVTKLINIDRDLLVIPSLAIHMNRKANEEASYNVQEDMKPLLTGGEKSFMAVVAQETGIREEDILGYDLYVCPRTRGTVWGAENEFISAPHLDDLQCAFGNLRGFMEAEETAAVPVYALFDNEEVGSRTKQGADSTFLEDVLGRIAESCKKEYRVCTACSFMVSADNAHAVHPNYSGKADPVNRPAINGGIVLKFSGNQKYTSDAVSAAVFRSVCEKADVPVQVFTNRSDMVGGSTLGNISNSHVSLHTVDIGLPQLAMHSPWETAGVRDTEYLVRAMKTFFSSSLAVEDGAIRIG